MNDGKGSSTTVVAAPPDRQTLGWVIAILLAVIATVEVLQFDRSAVRRDAAWAQAQPGTDRLGARGIHAFTGQLTRTSFGLFMLDVDTGTVWCYEFVNGVDGTKQLRLVAARSWVFDRYLEEFNVGDPTPAAVADLVEQQVSRRKAVLGAPGADAGEAASSEAPAVPGK
ncbi:MAG: hypothetical protein JXA69_14815 [Phycisphaerae bacterium]|nr:hypothetical protein [Phycisphaerae bacterium]